MGSKKINFETPGERKVISGCDLSEQQSIDSNIVAAVLFELFLMLFLSLDVWFEVVCSWFGDVFQMSYMFAAVFGMRCLLWLGITGKSWP